MNKKLIVLLTAAGTLISGALAIVIVDFFSPREMVKDFLGGNSNVSEDADNETQEKSEDTDSETQEKSEDTDSKTQEKSEDTDNEIQEKTEVVETDNDGVDNSESGLDYSPYGFIQPEEFYPGTDVPSFAYLADISEVIPSYNSTHWLDTNTSFEDISDQIACYSYWTGRLDEDVEKRALKKFEQQLIDSGYVAFTDEDFDKFNIIEYDDDDLVYLKEYTFVRVRSVGGGPYIEIALNFRRFDGSELVEFPKDNRIEYERSPEEVMPAVEDRPESPIAIENLEWYEGFEGKVPKIDQFLTTAPEDGYPRTEGKTFEHDLSVSVYSADESGNSGFRQSFENYKTTLLALGFVQKSEDYFYLYGEDKILKIYAYWSNTSWTGAEDIYIYVNDDYNPIYDD
ncbi:MAG: hypothetical protein LBM93_07695 [Oscillospiraceae bacterium]|jgi:hypothetical protein|nr:hypothetical protein [Oscillospiraceae bacterium]